MAEAAVEAGVQLVVICGGDGTVMACLDALSHTGVPVAVLPIGSGNLLARNLGIPLGLDDSLDVAVNGDDRRIDLGGSATGRVACLRGKCPAALAGSGDADAAAHRRRPGGESVRTNGFGGQRRTVEGGLELLPAASADDGLLDVVVVAPRTLREGLRVAYRIIRKPHTRDRHLERIRGQAISIEADRDVPRQVDGEVIDDGRRIDARIEPGALIVRVPRSTAAAA